MNMLKNLKTLMMILCAVCVTENTANALVKTPQEILNTVKNTLFSEDGDKDVVAVLERPNDQMEVVVLYNGKKSISSKQFPKYQIFPKGEELTESIINCNSALVRKNYRAECLELGALPIRSTDSTQKQQTLEQYQQQVAQQKELRTQQKKEKQQASKLRREKREKERQANQRKKQQKQKTKKR